MIEEREGGEEGRGGGYLKWDNKWRRTIIIMTIITITIIMNY